MQCIEQPARGQRIVSLAAGIFLNDMVRYPVKMQEDIQDFVWKSLTSGWPGLQAFVTHKPQSVWCFLTVGLFQQYVSATNWLCEMIGKDCYVLCKEVTQLSSKTNFRTLQVQYTVTTTPLEKTMLHVY